MNWFAVACSVVNAGILIYSICRYGVHPLTWLAIAVFVMGVTAQLAI